jgi:uncharacterized protein (TIGR02001 family)
MQNNLKAAILAALLLAPAVSFAQEAAAEEESNFSWNLGVVSDYVFRGVSQSNREVALQGGLDYAFGDSGVYAGVWGSTVDYGEYDAPDFETDVYVGYNADLGEKFNFDVMLIRYMYTGEENGYGSVDYNEIITKFAMDKVATLTVAYTNDYSNSGEDVIYANLGNSWDLGKDFSLNAGFGRTFDDLNGDYNDWNVGISKALGSVEFGLNYYDTNLEERASDSVVFSVKIGG